MKQKLNLFVLAILLTFSASMFADNNALIEIAKKAYDKAEYKVAIENYNKVIASGEKSFKLHYNLGNAYYKNQEIGNAIYQYQLASKLKPSDEDTKHNLTLANKLTKDQIEVKENYFAKNIESGILHTFTPTGWAWLSIISLVIGMLFFGVFRISNRLRKLLFWMGSLGTLICLLSFTLGYFALNELTSNKNAIVLVEEVSALNSPTENAKEQFKLHEGTKVNVLEISDAYTSVQLDNGNEGWIKTSQLGLY